MATRLYLPSNAFASTVAPAFSSQWRPNSFGTWPRPRRVLPFPVPSGLQLNDSAALTQPNASGESSLASPGDVLIAQYISDPIPAQTISGTIKGLLRVQESNGNLDARAQLLVRVVSGNGTVERGVLYAGDLSTGAPSVTDEWNSGAYSARWFLRNTLTSAGASPVSLTSVSAQAGDRLVLEIGARVFGNSAANLLLDPLATGSADLSSENTTSARSWVEFSQDLVTDVGSYHTDFSEYATGAMPGNWVKVLSAIPTWTVTTLAGATGGVVLRKAGGSSGVLQGIRRLGLTDRTDDEVRIKAKATTIDTFGPLLSTPASQSGTGCYRLTFNGTTAVVIIRNASIVATANPGFTGANNVYYWFYFKRTGALLQGKVWADGSSEPAGWTVQYTDPTPLAAGAVGIGSPSGSATVDIDVFEQGPAIVPATGRPKVWNGSAWTAKPAKVWNGSTWPEKPVKVWTGSAWRTVS